ncbi:hypothetical protein BJY52DRAFT_1269071 [Lactarius psammicola]|nr:hypothetical protein BJY52DRAFT_1269071 [Lactarius psammicola]
MTSAFLKTVSLAIVEATADAVGQTVHRIALDFPACRCRTRGKADIYCHAACIKGVAPRVLVFSFSHISISGDACPGSLSNVNTPFHVVIRHRFGTIDYNGGSSTIQ